MSKIKHDKRDQLSFKKRKTRVPARVVCKSFMKTIAMPTDISSLRYPIENDVFPVEFPPKAFNENGDLIVFCEGNWGTFDLQGVMYPWNLQTDISDGSFSHELGAIVDYSPESLIEFISRHGWFFLPYFDSQKRFLDLRYKNQVVSDTILSIGSGNSSFISSEIIEEFESGNRERKRLADLHLSFHSIWQQLCSQLSFQHFPGSADTFGDIYDIVAAVTLSEYARRQLKDDKNRQGGVISYYEVLLCVKYLQQAMRTVEEYDIAGTNLEMLREGISFALNSDENNKSSDERILHHVVASILDDQTKTDLQKINSIHWNYKNSLEKALRFLSLCFCASAAVTPVLLKCVEADGDALYGEGRYVDTRGPYIKDYDRYAYELITPHLYVERVFPEYFENIYLEGSYSAAVAAQFFDVLNDDAEWKYCKNPACNRYFKYKYSPGKVLTRRRQGDYCCDKCGNDVRNERNNAEASVITITKKRLKKGSPGYETIDKALQEVESRMATFYQGDEIGGLPEARKRWRRKLES